MNLEQQMLDLLQEKCDLHRENERLLCLFRIMFVDSEEYEIDIVKNELGTLLYNSKQVMSLFYDFIRYVEEYKIDTELALEYLNGRVG